MNDDPNRDLGPFVEGLVMAALDWPRLRASLEGIGWTAELTELDRHAVVFISPSGLRWRIVAALAEAPEAGGERR